ncbi:GNAT family N-acetyltransferase [bacterium]|nr:GNAT family N-acetyltransferase [bacterium]
MSPRPPLPVRVRRATLDEILALRHAVLRPGRPLASAHFDGDGEPTTVHLAAALETGEVVGCCTLLPRPHDGRPGWQLRGMATRTDVARRGVGSAVLRAAAAVVRDHGGTLLWCNARLAAVPFYASAGWRVVSDAFDVPGIGPHHVMLRELPAATRSG